MRPLTRRLAVIAAGLTTMTGLVAVSPSAHAATTSTEFAMAASGFGTQIAGGNLPTISGKTGFANFACTNLAGKDKRAAIADVEVPGAGGDLLIDVGAGQSRTWSTKVGERVSVNSQHSIADVKLLGGVITLNGISSTAKAYHDGNRFRAWTQTRVADISVLGLPGIAVPTPGNPVTVPGLARIAIGNNVTDESADGAVAKATGLRIDLLATKTTVWVAYSQSNINRGISTALFGGSARGVSASALGGAVTVSPKPKQSIPCTGSNTWRSSSLAGVTNIPGIEIGAIDAKMIGHQNAAKQTADGIARTDVARIALGNGALVIEGLRAQSRVMLEKGKVVKNSSYVTAASVTVNGQTRRLADLPTIEIPGVAKIETGVMTKPGWNHAKMVALRIELLQGSAVSNVVEVGSTEVKVRPSGL